MSAEILDQRAAAVIEANKYLTLGTVDADGLPWVTPVYFTPDGHDTFYWCSSPAAWHSRNIATTPTVSIAIFDSSVRIGGASAVYFRAQAELVPDEELEASATLFSSRYPELRSYDADAFRDPDDLLLYRARATEHWILVRGSDPDFGKGIDSRLPVWQ